MSRKSKFLSLVLRHHPEEIGVTLDAAGWVHVDELLRKLSKAGRRMSRTELETLVQENDKQRFTLSADGNRIRAAQGHSLDVDLGLHASDPPATLFHGTARRNLDSIFSEGIGPGKRRMVHLSTEMATALTVGSRHGRAVILEVDAARMAKDGHIFQQADNGVWMTKLVPAQYLGFCAPEGI